MALADFNAPLRNNPCRLGRPCAWWYNARAMSRILLDLPKILGILKKEVRQWKEPVVGTFAHRANAPFKILISTVLSLRTKDKTTEEASHRLFRLADSPQKMRT